MPSENHVHRVNLSRVPEFARPAILEQIARDEGIAVEDIIVEV
jgi:hypothetical protein